MSIDFIICKQECINKCEKLLKMLDEDAELYNEATSGILLDSYNKANEALKKTLKELKNEILNLQPPAEL